MHRPLLCLSCANCECYDVRDMDTGGKSEGNEFPSDASGPLENKIEAINVLNQDEVCELC
jgi:hypothetical protein